MKIPTTPPGGAPYYHGPPVNGMEMNPQWQGNGVVIDGPPPGNGAAFILPHHVHPASAFVPAAGFYGPGGSPPAPAAGPAAQQDFSEYMWMENEEEFDKQVMQQLEEEALMEQCIEAMMADERDAQNRVASEVNLEEQISKSTLNPLAAEFVPTFTPLAIPSTSDQDPQPSVSVLSSNTSKSIESSMSELSISQTSDAPTESSKSSTGEVPEELCNLPLDATVIRSEQEKEETDTKMTKIDTVVVVSAVTETVTKSQKSEVTEVCKIPPKDDAASKKIAEAAKSKPEPKTQKQDSKDVKSVKSDNAAVKSSKPQDAKPETAAKKPESKSSNQGKGNQTAAKGKASEPKPKESDKPKSPETTIEPVIPIASAPSLPEVEKPQPAAAPAVFNYAAAARANLPAKPPTQPAPVQSVASPASAQPVVKQDSVPKDIPNSAQPSSASNAAKTQTKPGPKQTKPRETKEPSKGAAPTRGAAAGPRKNKK